MPDNRDMQTLVDFDCLESDCGNTVQFDLLKLREQDRHVACSHCHRQYEFDKDFVGKLEKLRRLVIAVQEAEDILGDCNVSVTTPMGEVKIPYRLLLTRLSTLISLDIDGQTIDFHYRVEPLNESTFR